MPAGAVAGGDTGLRIQLLGEFRVRVGDHAIAPTVWRLRKASAIVKLLAIAPGQRLHREQLLEHLWPALPPEAATNNLYQAVHAARRALEPRRSRGTPSAYLSWQDDFLALESPGQLWTDIAAFEQQAAGAKRTHDPVAYRDALSLYEGDLLPEDRYEDWTASRREDLRRLALALLVELSDLHIAQEEFSAAIEALQQAVVHEPTHEAAHVGLMRLQALTGQRSQALRQYQQLREALQQDLAVEPEAATQQLFADISAGRFPAQEERASATAPADHPTSFPLPLTSFIGREQEQQEIRRSLAAARLLTIAGPGGSGKTRLALEVARELRPSYADGVWLVDLAPLADPQSAPRAVASVLGIHEVADSLLTETIVQSLRAKRLLLLLDNCEHLVSACAALTEAILQTCPQVRVLATSRAVIGLPGEVVWSIPPLSFPDDTPPSPAQLASYDAIRLFVERAQLRQPGFAITDNTAPAVVRVCQRLDGLPLAIELAAARMGVLSVEQIAARLDERLHLLTAGSRTAPSRQQTLRATMDWSYALLTERERRLLNRLAVFAGGATVGAVEAVCAGEGITPEEVLDLLSHLVDQSLVVSG